MIKYKIVEFTHRTPGWPTETFYAIYKKRWFGMFTVLGGNEPHDSRFTYSGLPNYRYTSIEKAQAAIQKHLTPKEPRTTSVDVIAILQKTTQRNTIKSAWRI